MKAAFLYLQVMAAAGIGYDSGARNGHLMSCGRPKCPETTMPSFTRVVSTGHAPRWPAARSPGWKPGFDLDHRDPNGPVDQAREDHLTEVHVLRQVMASFTSQAGYSGDFGALFAAVVITVVPVLIINLIFQRQLQGSVSRGTSK